MCPPIIKIRQAPWLAALAAAVSVWLAAGCGPQTVGRDALAGRAFFLDEPADVASFQLEAQTGAPFGTDDLAGHWSYLFFGFTNCPHICPTTMAVLAQAEEEIRTLPRGDEFRGVFVSVDPERDDRAAIAAYLARFSNSFLGLRGDLSETLEIAKSLDATFAALPDGAGGVDVAHSSHIVLIGPDGRNHGFLKAPHQVDTLVSTYGRLAH